MTLAEAIATPLKQRRSSRRAALRRSPLETLVVEMQSRVDFQVEDHAALSRLILQDRGREAVEDRNFERPMYAARVAVDSSSRSEQLTALERIARVHNRDEAAEDELIAALLSLLGVHNVEANDLRRLIHANARAITHGEDPVLDEDESQIPTALFDRQKAARA